VAKFRSHLSSDIFDGQTDFDDPVASDTGLMPASDGFPPLHSQAADLATNLFAGRGDENFGPASPSMSHDSGPGATTLFPGLLEDSGALGATIALAGASNSNSGLSLTATPPSASQAEIAFISGVTSSNKVAATSFWTWNGNSPATYSGTSDAAKWGSSTPGTSGGNVTYWFNTASAWTAGEKAA
jgi:hypothetical protein